MSPTLGLQQMEYGLLAGAIGLILVIAYCLFYYRGLGVVVISSLAVSGLIDVGTLEDWRRHVRPRGTIVADLDGVVFENHSRYFPPYWTDADKPIEANAAALRRWRPMPCSPAV